MASSVMANDGAALWQLSSVMRGVSKMAKMAMQQATANKHGVSKSNMAKSSKNSARNGNKSMAKANGEKQHGSKRWRR
jgi:hypothetical protein